MTTKRAVCLNCIDGRVQIPVINWIKEHYPVDYVDMITEPGMDGYLADSSRPKEDIYRKIKISIEKNNAAIIFAAGHHDCKGNPVDEHVHKEHIQQAVGHLKKEFDSLKIVGILTNPGTHTVTLILES